MLTADKTVFEHTVDSWDSVGFLLLFRAQEHSELMIGPLFLSSMKEPIEYQTLETALSGCLKMQF